MRCWPWRRQVACHASVRQMPMPPSHASLTCGATGTGATATITTHLWCHENRGATTTGPRRKGDVRTPSSSHTRITSRSFARESEQPPLRRWASGPEPLRWEAEGWCRSLPFVRMHPWVRITTT